MPRDPRETYDLPLLARLLQAARRTAGFDAFEYHEIEAILHSALPLNPKLPGAERGRIVSEAIQLAAQAGEITAEGLARGLKSAERAFFKRRPFKAVLVVPVSIKLPPSIHKHTVFQGHVTIARVLPSAFNRARANPELRIPAAFREHKGYSWLISRYSGRSILEAYDVALFHIDLVRAYWNYQLNRHTLTRLGFMVGPEPVNQIRLGRVHTLHAPGGRSLAKSYWDDTLFFERERTDLTDERWHSTNVVARRLQARLRYHPYRRAIERAFVRYVRALDAASFGVALVRLWALLETLTATNTASYDVTVRRALFLFQDRQFTKQLLEHLRDQRNTTVHDEFECDHQETYVFQLKACVEQSLAFHINSGRRYASIDEACRLMDQPSTRAELEAKIAVARHALRFQEL